MGEMITFKANGGSAEGYLASPKAPGIGVIVIQEWWGLNDQIKGTCDELANLGGFNALAPDFYHGKGARIGEPNEAQKLMTEFFRSNDAAEVARGAADTLLRHPKTSTKKVGVVGFCMGGGLAILAGAAAPDKIGAIVDCYGVGPKVLEDAKKVKAPVLGIFGGKDTSITPDTIRSLERSLETAGVSFEKHVYPEGKHAFLNDKRPDVFRREDSKDAWWKIIEFLKKHVR
ncbi:MAG TPA: dienelactone hydrolase family protein [Candidatus Limnocylindria bacterium]|nr:dienelactone hydrolase family protein [Candidatus Limnocylindria bacterium]